MHSFVRKGSVVTASEIYNLDTGERLPTHQVSGQSVNVLGYYPMPTADDTVVVQGDLPRPLAPGESVRVRVVETYTDSSSYQLSHGELIWDRTLGRPRNAVILPAGWSLTEVAVPAIISLDAEGRIICRFNNPRNDEIHVILKAKHR